MAFCGNILTILTVITGVLAGATAYHASLDLPNDQLVGLTLAVGAGVKVDKDGKPKIDKKNRLVPLYKTGTPLTKENLKVLREKKVQLNGREITVSSVKVNEFALSRWSGKWVFFLSAVGMIAGVLMTRRAVSRQATLHRESGKSEDLLAALGDAQQNLDNLHGQLEAAPNAHAALPEIVQGLTDLGADLQVRFIDHLEVLRSVLPTGTMAEVMESYAVAERFSNRARSTAVDDDPHESLESLATATERMGDTIELLKKSL